MLVASFSLPRLSVAGLTGCFKQAKEEEEGEEGEEGEEEL